jgi:hypothetical protein
MNWEADARRRSDSGTGYPPFMGHEFSRNAGS